MQTKMLSGIFVNLNLLNNFIENTESYLYFQLNELEWCENGLAVKTDKIFSLSGKREEEKKKPQKEFE